MTTTPAFEDTKWRALRPFIIAVAMLMAVGMAIGWGSVAMADPVKTEAKKNDAPKGDAPKNVTPKSGDSADDAARDTAPTARAGAAKETRTDEARARDTAAPDSTARDTAARDEAASDVRTPADDRTAAQDKAPPTQGAASATTIAPQPHGDPRSRGDGWPLWAKVAVVVALVASLVGNIALGIRLKMVRQAVAGSMAAAPEQGYEADGGHGNATPTAHGRPTAERLAQRKEQAKSDANPTPKYLSQDDRNRHTIAQQMANSHGEPPAGHQIVGGQEDWEQSSLSGDGLHGPLDGGTPNGAHDVMGTPGLGQNLGQQGHGPQGQGPQGHQSYLGRNLGHGLGQSGGQGGGQGDGHAMPGPLDPMMQSPAPAPAFVAPPPVFAPPPNAVSDADLAQIRQLVSQASRMVMAEFRPAANALGTWFPVTIEGESGTLFTGADDGVPRPLIAILRDDNRKAILIPSLHFVREFGSKYAKLRNSEVIRPFFDRQCGGSGTLTYDQPCVVELSGAAIAHIQPGALGGFSD